MQGKRDVAQEALPFHQAYTEFFLLTTDTKEQTAPSPQQTQIASEDSRMNHRASPKTDVKGRIERTQSRKTPPSFKNIAF